MPRRSAALSVVLGALAVGFGIALMTTAGYLISRAAERPPILSLTVAIVAVRFFGLARPVTRYLDRLVSHDLALRALGRLRVRVYERLEPLAPAELGGYRHGELLARTVGDVDSLQGLYVRGFGPPLVALLVGGACVGVMAYPLPLAAVVLAAGLLAGGLVVPAVALAVGRRSRPAAGPCTRRADGGARRAPARRARARRVRPRRSEALARVTAADRELVRLGRRDALAAGLGDGLMVLVAGATTAGVLAVAVVAHDAGNLDRVLVATLALLALSSIDAVAPLPAAARELWENATSGRRILELIDREPSVNDPRDPIARPPGRPAVALEDVTARYSGADEPALRGVDLVLPPGRHVALVGASGAGKTTVTGLLLRFLDPEQGRVAIAGHDARDYRQEDVRATFALAGQDAHVFDATIRANLLVARPDASDADLRRALARVRLDAWVDSLPDGLDTLVGEDGSRLSGGQRQRLTVARALLTDAPVLLLDEPTAHLDTATAEAFVHDVLAASEQRSVLLITHRPEGLDLVDEIVRLDHGRVVDRVLAVGE